MLIFEIDVTHSNKNAKKYVNDLSWKALFLGFLVLTAFLTHVHHRKPEATIFLNFFGFA